MKSYPCKSKDVCYDKSVSSWEINWADSETIVNLITHFGLYCDELRLGLFGSFFLLGNVVGSVTITRVGDIYGRKYVLIVGLVIYSVMSALMIVIKNYYLGCVFAFAVGLAVTTKMYVGFTYLLEM